MRMFRYCKYIGASPCEKAKEKVQRHTVTFLCLNMKENKALGHKRILLAYFSYFWDLFDHIGSPTNKINFFRIMLKTKFGTVWYYIYSYYI